MGSLGIVFTAIGGRLFLICNVNKKNNKETSNNQLSNMKKLILVLTLSISFTFSSHLGAEESFDFPEPISRVYNQITVGVSPNVELISIVQTIGQYPTVFGFLMAQDTSEYKTDVLNHFKPYQQHPAVLMFDRLSLQPRMLNFSAPSNIMLYTDKSFRLREDIELDDFVIKRAGGMDSLRVFLDLLRDFALRSSFNQFFHEHQDFYSRMVDKTIENLGPINYISELESFYGVSQNAYNIILVSLYHFVGYGNSLLCENKKRELYNTMGPQKVSDNEPFFGDLDYMKYMIRHEFSHPFINPLTEKYWDYLKEYDQNFDSLPEIARKNICGDWQECVNEFTIRAITTQLAFNESEEAGQQAYEIEKACGVSNLDSLLECIRYYQMNRDTYTTLESYYLNIFEVFKQH